MFSFRHIGRSFSVVLLLAAGAAVASAQVVPSPAVASPADAPPVLTTVTVTGTGFPTGTINAASVSVTITPPAGNGSPVSVAASAVVPPTGGGTRNIQFKVPASLTAAAALASTVTVSGQTTAAVAFTTQTGQSWALTVDPPAAVLSVSPGAGTRGTNVNLNVVGYYTHFTAATPVVTLTGPGGAPVLSETAGSVVVSDKTHLSVQFAIPANATAGTYLVTVKTGTETANLANGFLVSTNPGLTVTSISPGSGAAGSCLSINIVGGGTSWVNGVTQATMGDGITINGTATGPLNVTDSTHASIPICIDPITPLGNRGLTITTGGEYEMVSNAFTVTANGSSLQSVAPNSGPQGTNATVVLTGVGTHWEAGATTVSFGGGIVVGNITVNSPTSLTANISIPAATGVGSYGATATTNGEVVSLPAAFGVTLATPYLQSVSPTSGLQGQTNLNVVFTGVFTSFLTGVTANFGSDITVNGPVVLTSNTSATANISISPTAFVGGRTASITTNGTIYNFLFTVVSDGASITNVAPANGIQGASVALIVNGNNTHWAPGLTNASLGSYIVVNRVQVNSATNAEVDITIPSSAPIGAYSLTMSTNGEIVTASSAFTVLPYTATMSITPSSGMIGSSASAPNVVNVNFSGNFTHWMNSASATPTVADIDGEGVTIQNFQVTSANSAIAQFVIASTAPASPAVLCTNQYGGNRIVTLETSLGGLSSEIVKAGFCVTSTPAQLISITPYQSGEPAGPLQVTITGQYTHFTAGVTTVGFGPEIVVVPGSVNVISSTVLTAQINIPANTPIGWLPVFVNTVAAGPPAINEQLTIGFVIVPPATASLVSVSPSSGVQGQSLTVNIVGNLTNFNMATTQAILGAGITVNQLTINSTASATAQISISPTTYVGGRTVTMVSGVGETEVVSGPLFSVTQGVATISGVGCGQDANTAMNNIAGVACVIAAQGIPQGTITTFAVQGTGTHWLQGETTLDFGSGITNSNLVIDSPTLATAQIVVSYSAALGFRQVTATTNGEVAPSFTDAINIVPAQGNSASFTPTSSPQGTTITMQVQGINTHFTANNTVASFGNNNGVNVIGYNVMSPTTMNLTVQIAGTAYIGPYTLTITTTGLPVPPNTQSTEQIILPNSFSVGPGAAIITHVTPTTGAQGTTAQLQVTGQNTSWVTGVTTAYLSTAGCNPPFSAGVNVSNVTASSNTSATVSIAISPTAPTGFQTLCMYTLGESVSYGNAFTVTPGEPTLNSVTTPTNGSTGQQGQIIANIALVGQYTHWVQGTSTVTFGLGVNITGPLQVTSPTTAMVSIAIDPLAYTGGRNVVVTTGTEVVSGNFFTIIPGPAIISTINPSSANQGQHILMTINGQFTHWSQGLTQFNITGAGYDVTVNGVVINSNTQAVADLTFSPTATLGTRSVFMSTEGENEVLSAGFLTTGGIPAIISVSPNTGTVGDVGDNVIITGAFTNWGPTTVVDFGDPNVKVTNYTVNSSTSITAVVNIVSGATIGIHVVTVRTGTQALLSQYNVLNPAAPPTPYISYEYPSTALVGQTLQVNLIGAYTKWDVATTTATFGAGIIVNTFQVLGPTSATANITIIGSPGVPVGELGPGSATPGSRTVTLTTGTEIDNTTFYVAVGTPVISLVDPSSAIEGDTRDVDLVGQYTTWQQGVTSFSFCSGIVINSTTIFGPNAARVNITVPVTQPTGGCGVVANTNTEHAYNISPFGITPSTARILSVMPNTAIQGSQGFAVAVVGAATHWDNTTNFSLGGIGIATTMVVDATHANLTLNLAQYQAPGLYSMTAETAGEVAQLNNAFVVQPGSPILLSSTPNQFQQQAQFSIGILGQYTSFTTGWPAPGATTVSISGGGVNISAVNVTGPQSITVLGTVNALAYTGCSNIIVTTGTQVLTLYSAFCITNGPAAITNINPNSGLTGTSNLPIVITGTNTNFIQGTTNINFGPGIAQNGPLNVVSPTVIDANITIAANATPEGNNFVVTTAGEVATGQTFTIMEATPVIDIVSPSTGAQGQVLNPVQITGSFTHFELGGALGSTTATVGGSDITATVLAASGTSATLQLNISPIATLGNRTVQLSTPIGGGNFEVATWTGHNFVVTAGNASISSIAPVAPLTAVHQNDTADILLITGSNTHFTLAPLTNASVVFCSGVNTAAVQVVDDTHIKATVNVAQGATVGACGVTVTTGGEVAASGGTFNVLAGLPIITSISQTTGQQGQVFPSVTINGLYTHFTSGALTVTINGVTATFTPNSDISATSTNFTVSASAATGAQTINVSDTTDGALAPFNSFTITAGTPTILSVSPTSVGPGLPVNVTITGEFTHFSASSIVTFSGSGVSAGAIVGVPTNTSLTVPISVVNGSTPGTRTLTVTTVGEVAQLSSSAAGAFTVLAGVPNILSISPNVGVPNSVVNVTITGINTNWQQGVTTANFGQGISVNGAAAGTPGLLTVNSTTSATATLTISAGATVQANSVVVNGPTLLPTAVNGFTIQNSTTTPPVLTFISPTNGAGSVATNTPVTLEFSEPLNPATVTAANVFISQSGPWPSSGIPAIVAPADPSNRVFTITPTGGPLSVGTTYYVYLNSAGLPSGSTIIEDQSGNKIQGYPYYSFTTGLTADLSGPTLLTTNIPAGATNVPTNTQNVTFGFNKPIDPATQAAGLSVMNGAVAVPGTWSYNTTFTQAYFTPAGNTWTASTTYTVGYTASLLGSNGVALTNPNSFQFTTSTGADSINGAYITWTPPQGSQGIPTTGTLPTIRFVYNKPINPLTVTPSSFYVYNNVTDVTVLGTTITYTPDFKTFTLTLPGPLEAGTEYRWVLSGASDWVGNYVPTGSVYWFTGTGLDTTAPFVTSISPSSTVNCTGGNPCAPVNAKVTIQFSELMDPTSLTPGAVTLTPTSPAGPAINATLSNFSFSPAFTCTTPSASGCNFGELTFEPSANLAANTTYQIAIPDGQLADLSGNFDPFTSSFTTGSSTTPVTTNGNITSITPSSGSTNAATNSQIVAQLNAAVDPLTVNSTSFYVFDNTNSPNVVLPGTVVASANQLTLTYTPANPYQANHRICYYLSYEAAFYDLAGNAFNGNTGCFTVGAGSDTTAPTVISVTPTNGATGIGPNNPVTVIFSKPMNPGTFSNNVAVYNGSSVYATNYSYSNDGTMLYFNVNNMPWNTTLTVVVNPAVTDLAGNHLASEFSSTFTTMPQPLTTSPTVTSFRPGANATNVAATTPIGFFLSSPMNAATINSTTLQVSQNGTIITGAISVTGSTNQNVTFTPTGGAFAAGAYITVFFTSGAQDINGNALTNYQASFTIAASLTGVAPTVTSCRYGCGIDPNGAIEYVFSKPLNPATVNGNNFYVLGPSNTGNPLAGTISLLDNGRLLRFQPTNPLSGNSCAAALGYLTSGLQDTTGIAFAGSTTSYFGYVCTSATPNSAAPSVSATAPTNGATSIGTNAVVSVTFSANVDQNTVDPSNVTLTGPGGNIPLSLSYNSSNFTMTVTPQEPLPVSSVVTLTINGITDVDGHTLNPTPYALTFTTQALPDFNPPVFVSSNITNNQGNVPVNTSITFTFNKPIDFRSVILNNTVYFQDVTQGYTNIPVTLTPVSSSAFLVTPNAALSVNHQYRVYASSIADLNGNTSTTYQIYFTTVLAALSGGPVVTQMTPVTGSTPPVNFSPMVQFDRPVAPTSLAGVTLTKGGSPVPATAQLSSGGTVLTMVPTSILTPTSTYVFTVAGVQDVAGNTMTGSATRSFTTGPGIELTSPSITSVTPVYNSTTGENPELYVEFSEQINPITIGSWYLYNTVSGEYVQPLTLNWAANYQSVRVAYPGTLNPGSRYYFYTNSYCNLPGNCSGMSAQYFYTGTSVDNSSETVTSVNPPNGAAGVPTNPAIALVLAKPAAPTSVTNSSVTISPAVTGGTTVSLSTDGYTLTVGRGANLAPNTLYTISVSAGAFTDGDGNAVAAFSSTFTTGANAEASGSAGSISMTLPTPGTTGAALTTSITATFTNPINPQSLNSQSFVVYWNNNGNYGIAGTVANPTPTTLVFTPAVALPASATINVYVGYYSNITDYAGNAFSALTGCCNTGNPPVCSVGSNACFQTGNAVDNTPPQVISMSPAPGSTNVGPYAPVSLTFNKSLDYTTINSTNFAMYNGASVISQSVSYSGDRRTVTFNGTLPYNASIEIAVNTGVKDYAGHNMANAYQASFTTLPTPATSAPSVIQGRPGSGAPVTTPITLFMSAPMNLSTVQAGMYVAQNGVVVPGTATLSADLRAITWTPGSSFQPGAYIEAYLTSTATDTTGNPATAYKLTFTTQAAATGAPTEVSLYPTRYNTGIYTTNTVVEVQFSRPLNPATVTSTTFHVSQGSGPGGTAIAGTLSLLNNNTLVRFTPTAPFPVSSYYYVTLTTGIQDAVGDAFAGDSYYLYVQPSAVPDTTPPAVSFVTPGNGKTGIGDNAPIRLTFNKLVDTSTITSSSVQLTSGATPLPYTLSFGTTNSSTQTVATLLPLAPLPDSASINIQLTTGITDLTGAAIPAQTTSFTTMAGADFSAPVVVRQSIDSDSYTNIPTNATFTWVFNKPLDPASVIGNPTGGNTCCFYIYNSNGNPYYPPVNANLSADGLTVTLVPQANLSPGATNDYFYAYGATDLNGNQIGGYSQRFQTAATTNTTGPSIVETNPTSVQNINPNPVPTNTAIEVIYSAPVSNASLGAITLTTGGNPVPITAYLENNIYTDDTVVRILPTQLLLPNTTYTVTVTGVLDVAGNAAAGTVFSFTTGPNFLINATNFVSATVTTSGGTVSVPNSENGTTVVPNVLDSPTFVLTFSNPIDDATLLHSAIVLRDVNYNAVPASTAVLQFALSADQKTVTVTTNVALPTGTTFRIFVNSYVSSTMYDISGYGVQSGAYLYFTTQ